MKAWLLTASEHLYAAAASALGALGKMTPAQLGLNCLLTAVFMGIAIFTPRLARRGLRMGARRLPGAATADRTVRITRATRLLAGLIRVIVILAATVAIAAVWGVDIFAWASTGLGEQAMGLLLRLSLVFAAAIVAYEAAGLAITRIIGRVAAEAHEARRQAQLKTLGPLIQGVVQTAIIIVAVLMGLSELSVKIGPLLAGAGVVGIALGFGAQTLVKDFLTGLFLIAEDVVSVGDVIRIGDSGGLVEQMTLRSIRLRDFDGTLHIFPYSEAQVVHNLTKSFSYYVFDLQVSYDSDIDQALRIMRQMGEEMQADSAYADKILEPIEVVGVESLADSGVMLKARIKTRPIEQWTVGREYNRRIKLAFDSAGIEIPFPHMKVVLPESQLTELAARH